MITISGTPVSTPLQDAGLSRRLVGRFIADATRGGALDTSALRADAFTKLCLELAVSMLDGDANELTVFIHINCGRFAGGADDDDAVAALGDMPVNEATQTRVVQAPIVEHGRDDCDKRSGNHGLERNVKRRILTDHRLATSAARIFKRARGTQERLRIFRAQRPASALTWATTERPSADSE